ncbi:ketopantoate reductase family protein [Sinanaerobacter chloroacetimidivorans]|uniref:2-dehydropantoate 2-reductase n=1 Tax=Sinanaerobacter chloroacetimidivorans TaxID=2818044 RepID=A0A8J7W0N7_9FIRM|nr:2-dehydropantoate 2-reductase [Sinanaerobacter chloroacetimidivorans]MBR0598634.1 2-dehydropantoate 2-reductase [Sinanaerobacter chloroacetimidivorans]
MKIAIVGAGAMGCLYGAKLSAVPTNEVYLIDVWKEHIESINENGLVMEENGELIPYRAVKGVLDANQAGICDLVIVFVKSTLTSAAVKTNKAVFGPDTIALTLQNGLGNIDLIRAEIGDNNVIAGTTAHGATMLGPGKIRHAGKGKTIIGELNGNQTDRIERVAEVLRTADLETDISNNVLGLVWDKLLINVGINALTGITKLKNGELLDHPEIEELLEAAVSEAHAVAKVKGITLSYDDPISHTKAVCAATAANKSSMLQDVLNHKQTEIEMINGAIVQEGAKAGIATPVNLVLTNLIKYIQK